MPELRTYVLQHRVSHIEETVIATSFDQACLQLGWRIGEVWCRKMIGSIYQTATPSDTIAEGDKSEP